MKNEIKAFTKLIESQKAFEHFKNSINIFTDSKIETREELSKYAESNHKSEELQRIILDYLSVQREKIEKVYQNICQKGRSYTEGGNVLFIKTNKQEVLKNEIVAILGELDELDILEPVFKAYNHPKY
jgi:hypothetical protein